MIWCVEDDANIRELEIYALKAAGYKAEGFGDGDSFWNALRNEKPSLVILDVMLPEKDGFELLKMMRADPLYADLPVIMATARGGEAEKAQSLDNGADDYIVKPFSIIELVARVRAVLRRCKTGLTNSAGPGLALNKEQHLALLDGMELQLTHKEFGLLELFLANPNRVFEREQLLSHVWGEEFYRETRTVDMHIGSLRRKLGKYGASIETVRNVGYRYRNLQCLKKSS